MTIGRNEGRKELYRQMLLCAPDQQNRFANIIMDGNNPDIYEIKQAKKLYLSAAKMAYPPAQFNLAFFYELRTIGLRNKNRAVFWYTKSAENNYVLAQLKLARCYECNILLNEDIIKALYWYEKAAAQGDAEAIAKLNDPKFQTKVAFAYENAIGTEVAIIKALTYYEKAAAQGDAEAIVKLNDPKFQTKVASAYEYGVDTEVAIIKALTYYEMAAAQGNILAMERLENISFQRQIGLCYIGMSDERSVQEAIKWWLKAAEKNDSISQFLLGSYFETNLSRDPIKALYWYKKAAAQGCAQSLARLENSEFQVLIAFSYSRGCDTPKNEELAVEWCKKAADENHPGAMYSIANYYWNKNLLDLAVKYYKKAAINNNPEAQYTLAVLFEIGLGGVAENFCNALFWYDRAARLGHVVAEERLEIFQDNPSFTLKLVNTQCVAQVPKNIEINFGRY